jgi:NTE family protein
MVDIVLALGGGGIKGMSHLGVIRQLEKEGFHIKAIAGTSIGAMVGAFLAAGYSTHEIQNIFENADKPRLFTRKSGDGPSLLGIRGLSQILIDNFVEKTFADLKIPFACTAVDTVLAQEILLTQGRLVDAVLASCAIPGIFPPKHIGDNILVDGGVLDPVPVSLARCLFPSLPVIAVVLTPVPEKWAGMTQFNITSGSTLPLPLIEQVSHLRIAQAFSIFTRSMEITSCMMGELRLQIEKPDVIIRPDVGNYNILENIDQAEIENLIEIGKNSVIAARKDLFSMNSFQNQFSRRFQRITKPNKLIKVPENL